MSGLLAAPASLLDTLEQAKSLFWQERFASAGPHFERVAASAMPAAPDVWLEATYGLAECLRLGGDATAAAQTYRRVARHLPRLRMPSGRLARSSRVAAMACIQGLTQVSRLSLRVQSEKLTHLLSSGYHWARLEVEERAARLSFRYEQLLLERTRFPSNQVAEEFLLLAEELEQDRPDLCITEPMFARIRACETWLDASVLHHSPPPPPPRTHWAYQWASTMNQLLLGRLHLARGRPAEALRMLAALESETFALYPELQVHHAGLIAAASAPDSLPQETLRNMLGRAIPAALATPFGDLSTPLWQLAELILGQLRRMSLADSRERGAPLQRDLALLSECLQHTSLQQGLVGRGLSSDGLRELLRWSVHLERRGAWSQDGLMLLEPLRKVARP